jgi:hypothetical protein
MAQAALPLFLVACALKRFGAQASLRRTSMYDALLGWVYPELVEGGALHLNVFEQPADSDFFKNLLLLCQTNSFTIPSFRVKREIL